MSTSAPEYVPQNDLSQTFESQCEGLLIEATTMSIRLSLQYQEFFEKEPRLFDLCDLAVFAEDVKIPLLLRQD